MIPDIQPIKLLSGSHADTGVTGQGCFMNVIAYLNGESKITDQSTCVCPSIRPIAIWLNDFANDAQRQRLLPFVFRAMGSATDDVSVVSARLDKVVAFAQDMAEFAKRATASHTASHDASHAASHAAAYRAAATASHAAATASHAAYAAYAAAAASHAEAKDKIFSRCLQLMDEICPSMQDCGQDVMNRAEKLVALCGV